MKNASRLPLATMHTPAYVADVAAIRQNLERADKIRKGAGCKVLLATKAFSFTALFPMMRDYLDGTTASGLYEAKMGADYFGKEIHVYAPAYTDAELEGLAKLTDHIYVNSPSQLARYLPILKGKKIGIRINPEYSLSTVGGELYDPCAPCSRFGTRKDQLDDLPWEHIHTLHAHVLCESRTAAGTIGLIDTLDEKFGAYVKRVKAVNLGGGHFFNDAGFEIEPLIARIKAFREKYGVEVILEPGGTLVYDAGYLVTSVIDVHKNGDTQIAILDSSASCHMPDIIETNGEFTPEIVGATRDLMDGAYPHHYLMGGKTCMTGDFIATAYAFREPLKIGDKVVFCDQMQYSFVKDTTFNGTPLPDMAVLHEDGRYEVVQTYGYEDFLRRVGGPVKISM
ncbi:MAG: carboxynorspermidine decarboxylase [Alphaproteobacteria bacterium]|nr:carboxynorspermidine decarboxylase [Alphaproteobacteria bacterium]